MIFNDFLKDNHQDGDITYSLFF